MNGLIYRITLQEPTIVTALAGEPNSSVSFDYLPGSVLRGMLIGAYIRHFRLAEIDAADPGIRQLFFTVDTRFLNGYLVESITDQRALPAPLTWIKRKEADYPVFDSLNHLPVGEHKSVKGFWVVNDRYAYPAEPKRVLNVHNARNRPAGRALGPSRGGTPNNDNEQDRGTVFRYDALASGQTFEAVILCDFAEDAHTIAEVLNNTEHALLGGASSAGYGRVTLSDIRPIDEGWEEAPQRSGKQLIVTLLSDVILRDTNGHYSTTSDVLCAALRPFLGESITIANDQAYLGTTMHGGFNRKWGLPLPQMPALTMGSVIKIANFTDDEERLMSLVWNGIGERRNEGFGRVALNWQPFAPLNEPPTPTAGEHKTQTSPPELSEVSSVLWERTEQRMKQMIVENDVLRITYRKRYQIQGPITRTQLMRLRVVIKNELRKEKPSQQCFKEFFESIKGKAADQQIAQTKIGNNDLRNWLQNPEFTELREAAITDVIKLTLVDAVLERAIKMRQEKNHG